MTGAVLFVDDEPRILDGLRRSLRMQRVPFQSHFEVGGQAALAALERGAWDVVVTDMQMPDVDGAAVLVRARDLHPACARVILSGEVAGGQTVAASLAHRFLRKPCELDELVRVVKELLGPPGTPHAEGRPA